MQVIFQRLQRTDNIIRCPLHLLQRGNLRIGQHDIIRLGNRELPDDVANPLDVFARIQARTRRYHKRQYHARNRTVYARLQEQIPDNHTEEEEEYLLRYAELTHIVEEHVQDSRRNQVSVCHVSAIEQCDDQYAADVVHHGKCRQEYFQAQRHTLAQQTEHSQ